MAVKLNLTMPFYKIFVVVCSCAIFINCGGKDNSKHFSLATNGEKNTFHLGDTLKPQVKALTDKSVSNTSYFLNDEKIDSHYVLSNVKLGEHVLKAEINSGEEMESLETTITILNDKSPRIPSFEIVNVYPHDITSYTQGLEFFQDTLYESTGQYGESKLRKLDFATGKVYKEIKLDDNNFGEGLTILNGKIYQLTWRSNIGFVYDLKTFDKLKTFTYHTSKEGWGLCNDGIMLYKSDGTDNIWDLNPETLKEEGKIEVYTNKGRIESLNELEWVDGKIFANIYQRNGVAIINPENGAVEAVIDFSSLKEKVSQHPKLDVLNGIAYHADRKTFFVTGKRWDKMFEIRLIDK